MYGMHFILSPSVNENDIVPDLGFHLHRPQVLLKLNNSSLN